MTIIKAILGSEPAAIRGFRCWIPIYLNVRILMIVLAVALPLTGTSAFGANYYVALTGNDANPGTQAKPWRTIGKAAGIMVAGDTTIIGPGDYNEHVYQRNSGTQNQYITYRAEPARMTSLRALRLGGAYIKLEGLRFTRFCGIGNTWNAATRIDSAAHGCIITNCIYSDIPFVIAHDFRFDRNGNKIISASSDFIAAGFTNGSKVYLGASGKAGLWYTNHDTVWEVSSLTATTLWVTNSLAKTFEYDSGSNYWAVIRGGESSSGYGAINMVPSGGVGPSNTVISGNIVSNWIGSAFGVIGDGTVVENNSVTKLHSFRFIALVGNNIIVRSNTVRDCTNILYYTGAEVAALEHPAGTGWYDYQISSFAARPSESFPNNTNIVFAFNWFENIDNQMGQLNSSSPNTYGFTFHNNVFVGVSGHFSGGWDQMRWVSNTFYRAAFGSDNCLQIGSSPPQQYGYLITRNLFIDCGPKASMNIKGYYGYSKNAVNPVFDWNMVASTELSGFAKKDYFTEPNGVNGGDPVFLDVLNPLGHDGLPFTADDGLQVLPNSPAAKLGGGACGVYRIRDGQPVAHFRVTSPTGWFEPTGESYSPEWMALPPTKRGAPLRPYQTPSLLGIAPLTVTFDASQSISGVNGSSTSAGIAEYTWTVDRVVTLNTGPIFTHTFRSDGNKVVSLTVRNTDGNISTMTNVYRVFTPSGSIQPPAPEGVRVVGPG